MKILKKTIVVNLLIILLMTGIGSFSYYSYIYYNKQNIPQKTLKISTFLNRFNSLLVKIDNERTDNTNYLVSNSQSKFLKLLKTRETVDSELVKLNQYIKNNPKFRSYTTYIKELNIALRTVRENIDNMSVNYGEILLNSYHSKVFTPLLNMLTELSLDQNSKVLKKYLVMYRKIIELRENSALENRLISMLLLQKKPISSKEKVIWNQIIVKDRLPKFDTITNSALAAELHTLLFPDMYKQIISKERQQILKDANSGKYKTTLITWIDKIIEKNQYFTKAESMIVGYIKKVDEKNISQLNRLLIIAYVSAFLAIFLFFIMLKLLFIRSKQMNNKKIYEDTYRDIELVFDKSQQKKIKRLIENGQIDLIYKFLIKAIGDANQTKDLFLASMSHEIRTPLNGILGFTQLLKETNMTEEQNEFLLVVEKSSGHLLSIVNDILDLSKIKAQKIELESIEFDPIESFEATIESYAAKATEKNIDFNTFFDPQLPTLLNGDPTKISQVIVNLISNAIKFTETNGEINVSIEKLSESSDETKVKFSVSDTGIGVTKEQQKKIFDAFSQADISTSRKYGGTGLGLSISGKLIDLMNSELKIKSVKDEGSTFYFTLVLKKPKKATKREVENMSSFTIGILNSHIDNRYLINKNLETYIAYTGANIKHYRDEELLAIQNNSELPDILFIDHKFRHRDGELEKFIKLDTKIVVMTTGDQKRNLMPCKSYIDKILYKPVNFSKTLKSLSDKEDIAESKQQINFHNIHVLVAEDNLINQKLIINVLNGIGVEVSIANNGQEAVENRIKNEYDMIFMDIQMPVMGGMEATLKILSHERSNNEKHIPIIALTANALSGDREKYLGAGMDGYLSKPIEIDALRDIFREYFEERIVEIVN